MRAVPPHEMPWFPLSKGAERKEHTPLEGLKFSEGSMSSNTACEHVVQYFKLHALNKSRPTVESVDINTQNTTLRSIGLTP